MPTRATAARSSTSTVRRSIPQKYLLAWEDLLYSAGDRDYQDMVIVTQNITPVPLPAAVLFAPGLAMLGFVRRRKQQALAV